MNAKRKAPDVDTGMRYFVYAVFVGSTVLLLFAAASGNGYWLAPGLGVIVSIGPTIVWYLREQERRENAEIRREAHQQSGGGFAFADDED